MLLTPLDDEAARLGIVHPVACVLRRVEVKPSSHELDDEIRSLLRALEEDAAAILSRREVVGFKDLFARMGHPQIVPAGHRLIDTTRRRGSFKRINNVVDAYNLASAESGSGLGLHDASSMVSNIFYAMEGDGDVEVWTGGPLFDILVRNVQVVRAQGSEKIWPLFKEGPVPVAKGDLLYGYRIGCQDHWVSMAWLGNRDIDSDEHKVTNESTTLLLIALGNSATSEDYNRNVCLRTVELIHRTCPLVEFDFIECARAG